MSKSFNISVTVDTNDADYNTRISIITEEELNILMPLLTLIKANNNKYPTGEMGSAEKEYPQISEYIHECFWDICPFDEYGFHSIAEVKIWDIVPETTLL